MTREVFHRVIRELGGWDALAVDDLMRLHRYEPSWPSDPNGDLPKPLYDALTNGSGLPIRYVNAEGLSSSRIIHPETSFASGRYTYIRAFCEKSSETGTFRLDRIIVEYSRDSRPVGVPHAPEDSRRLQRFGLDIPSVTDELNSFGWG